MWFFQRACSDRDQSSRCKLCDRRDICTYLLQKLHQHRTPDHRMPEAVKGIDAGDEVEIDFDSGMIYNKTKGTEFKGQAFPEFMQRLINAGGLVNYINANTEK